ncbi:MAG TPA: AIR synthase-related protein, partial [Candidatus Polarisedimenticolia bacterium]|nr:AIR synthase-related protein [Candidatus Polarisedimenticolia bacterium]
PGDGVYVSGPLGGSALGRRLLETGWGLSRDGRSAVATRSRLELTPAERSRGAAALALHLDPAPRLALGRLLAAKRLASAAIDLSDGLSLDLARLADASGVGARLLTQALPIDLSARALAPRLGIDPLTLALHGGEDYELLFTVPASKERLLDALAARDPACRALFIGRVTSRRHGLTLEDPDGSSRRLPVAGYDHFKVE